VTPRLVVNGLDVELEPGTDTPPGYRIRGARIGPLLGAQMLGATIYELDPGESVCPYHYEYGNEEWLLVLAGRPTLRQPDGEQVLEPGDVVAFPDGPEGGHKVTNRTDATVRILMLSTMNETSIAVFADSGKVVLKPLRQIFRQADAIDYWDGE
jgi:uncharacterized cupin superfamily protein